VAISLLIAIPLLAVTYRATPSFLHALEDSQLFSFPIRPRIVASPRTLLAVKASHPTGEHTMSTKGATLKQKTARELREFLLISLYLWIFFGAFITFKALILAQHRIDFVAHGVALINALALGKIMLIARAFKPGKRADDAPLIYPTLLKSAIFAVILAVFKVLEDAAIGYFHGRTFTQSIADLAGGSWQALLALTAILFVVLIPITAFGELQRVLGERTLGRLFLRPRDVSKPFSLQPTTNT
jgi:hypothetical protein